MTGDHTVNKIYQSSLAVFVIVAFIFSSGCDSRKSRSQKSPSEVVKAAYLAANEGNYSTAENYFSSELIDALKGDLGATAGGMKGVWDKQTRDGTIDKIEILKEEVRGEGATVDFRIHFKNGKTRDVDKPLIKENGRWKLTLD